jgi:hypothetical protein
VIWQKPIGIVAALRRNFVHTKKRGVIISITPRPQLCSGVKKTVPGLKSYRASGR